MVKLDHYQEGKDVPTTMRKALLGILAATIFGTPIVASAEYLTVQLDSVLIGSERYNITFIQDASASTRFIDLYGLDGGGRVLFSQLRAMRRPLRERS